MSEITDWIHAELVPSIFEHVPELFPEHDFKKFRQNWQSKTYLDGTPHKDRVDKTVITAKKPSSIFEQGGDHLGIIDYVIKRDNLVFIDAVKKIASIVGMVLPEGEVLNKETFMRITKKRNLLSTTADYFSFMLFTDAGKPVLEYLLKRGYTEQEIKEMDLGFVPALPQLTNYLISKSFTEQEIKEILKFPTAEGKQPGISHTLSIPFINSGTISGFKFRTISDDVKPKYINTADLPKNSGFFGLSTLKGDKDLIIVEGDLDALFASVKGVENIVATAGSNINEAQIKEAIRFGAKKFTICFDREATAKQEEIVTKSVNSAITVIRNACTLKIYVALLPNGSGQKNDPDSFIRTNGVEAFKEIIEGAIPAWLFTYHSLLGKYTGRELTAKNQEDLTDEVVLLSSTLPPDESGRLINEFKDGTVGQHLKLTEKFLSDARDRIIADNISNENKKYIANTLNKAGAILGTGDLTGAIKELKQASETVEKNNRATEFNYLLVNPREEDIAERLKYKPESLDTGFEMRDEQNDVIPIILPAGALSFVTAPTSHGKTAVLVNALLNLADQYPKKEFHLFSYEEDSDAVLIRALNTFINEDLSRNYYETNRDVIKAMLIDPLYMQHTEERRKFENGKDAFFAKYIHTGRIKIHYVSYGSSALNNAIRFLRDKTNVGAILIDYMQLIQLDEDQAKRTMSRQEQLKRICLELKDSAVDTGLPIFLAAQFNREVVNPSLMHPTKISEAGDIERIANVIMAIWNTGKKALYKEAEKKSLEAQTVISAGSGNLYIVLLKNRDNVTDFGSLLSFRGKTGKITNRSNL